MNNEYISIAEFAKRAGVSVQAIYKRLDKDFQPWLKVESGKKYLNIKALSVFKNEKTSTEVESMDALKKALDLMSDQNETLKAELAIKNEQIKSRDSQIEALSERLKESHVLLDHQQKLHAANLIEERTGEADLEEETRIERPDFLPKSRFNANVFHDETPLQEAERFLREAEKENERLRRENERYKNRTFWQRLWNK